MNEELRHAILCRQHGQYGKEANADEKEGELCSHGYPIKYTFDVGMGTRTTRMPYEAHDND